MNNITEAIEMDADPAVIYDMCISYARSLDLRVFYIGLQPYSINILRMSCPLICCCMNDNAVVMLFSTESYINKVFSHVSHVNPFNVATRDRFIGVFRNKKFVCTITSGDKE
jgi:hypothetical protein